MGRKFRTYVTIDITEAEKVAPGFVKAYAEANRSKILESISGDLAKLVTDGAAQASFPSLDYPPRAGFDPDAPKEPGDTNPLDGLSRLVIAFESEAPEAFGILRDGLRVLGKRFVEGADLAFDVADHWCPGAPLDHQFDRRAGAGKLIRTAKLRDEDLDGKDVNVVVVDRGLNAHDITTKLGGTFGGGWEYCPDGRAPCIQPGTLKVVRGVTKNDHGMMVARNVLGVAPCVTLHDFPVIPERIVSVKRFLSDAHAAFERLLADLRRRCARQNNERWVLVNAWAIFDRATEVPLGSYSANPNHPFNRLVGELVDENVDVVFSAGNCGQFCPDGRCGPYDVGPGKSVYGANAHPRVLSVGAVRADGIWIGSSSQGPGPGALATEKPDLTGPSMFTETTDRHTRNGGTSAACAVAAGVVAALRQRWGPMDVSPDTMRYCLRHTAWRAGPPGWDDRLGCGVINAETAWQRLVDLRPACAAGPGR